MEDVFTAYSQGYDGVLKDEGKRPTLNDQRPTPNAPPF
jgi:hypothetical protein